MLCILYLLFSRSRVKKKNVIYILFFKHDISKSWDLNIPDVVILTSQLINMNVPVGTPYLSVYKVYDSYH